MKKNKCISSLIILLLIITINTTITFAQRNIGGTPPSFIFKEYCKGKDSIETKIMPTINVDSIIIAHDTIGGPYKFGYAIDVNFGISNSGTWDTLLNGDKIWRLNIHSQDAFSINLIYDDFWMPEGSQFFVYNFEKDQILGAFTEMNNKADSTFATFLTKGDITTLEYYEPAGVTGSRINITKVIHGYSDFLELGNSAYCQVDINCPEGDESCIEKHSVVRIWVPLPDNAYGFCSGVLISNVKENLTPYILTADHCLFPYSEDLLSSLLFQFQYWNPICNEDPPNPNVGYIFEFNASEFDYIRSPWTRDLDMGLLRISDDPFPSGYGITYAGWNASLGEENIPPNTTSIHHPIADVMKISIDYNEPIITTRISPLAPWEDGFWMTDFDIGTSEPGSSGSPLFDDNKRIIGSLSGPYHWEEMDEYSDLCVDPFRKILFGRFDLFFDYYSIWRLDPDNTGIRTIGPTSPPIFLINRTLTGNYKFAALKDMHIEGNVTTNVYPKCQQSNVPFTAEPGSNVEIKAKSITIHPGTTLKAGSNVTITATDEINCEDNIVAGDFYENCYIAGNIPPPMIKNHNIIDNQHNIKVFAKIKEDTYTTENILQKENIEISEKFIIYPNPFTDNTQIAFSLQQATHIKIYITNIYGKKIKELYNNHFAKGMHNLIIEDSELKPGLYFCIIETLTGHKTIKMIKM